MDNEKLFEFMEKMYADLKSSQEKMYVELKSSQEKMYVEMQQGFKDVNGRIDGLEKEVKKINFTMENDIKPKISVLFEGYSSNKEETERKLEEIIKEQRETKEILTLSIKSLSEDIKNLNEKMDKVEKVTMKNTYDVEYLKLAK
ncbi:hypothetical protein SAMN05443428_12225 [Caloramator quimbayensis]|uniref:Uncharacterized protein n=1 Tax=Caloramator quimbayensis TaxID=1147123 RepID=A0A1T4Y4M0_9CLOT|nr:hypothetical protein [Caloramator quimbayensis]SKA96729.1 hypothetical protein SAMN05443428_12225 [Caloramator quimbayensis]